jgi:hypothetical protein
MAKEQELMTTGKMAEAFGVSAGKIKKAITELGIEPDAKKGACAYYSEASAKKIKSAIK